MKLSLSRDAVDGRYQTREIEVDPGCFRGGLRRLDLSSGCLHAGFRRQIILNGIVEVLLARGLYSGQRSVPLHVKLGSALNRFGGGKLGLGLGQLSLRLIERCLKWARIDLEEQLTLLDERAFLVTLPHDVAGDLRPDVGIRESVERADPFAKNRNILLLNLHDLNVRRRGRIRHRYMAWPYCSNNQSDDNQGKRHANPEFVFRRDAHFYLRHYAKLVLRFLHLLEYRPNRSR